MAIRYSFKVIQFNPTTATEITLTNALIAQGDLGWEFVQSMQVTTTKAFAMFKKIVAE